MSTTSRSDDRILTAKEVEEARSTWHQDYGSILRLVEVLASSHEALRAAVVAERDAALASVDAMTKERDEDRKKYFDAWKVPLDAVAQTLGVGEHSAYIPDQLPAMIDRFIAKAVAAEAGAANLEKAEAENARLREALELEFGDQLEAHLAALAPAERKEDRDG
jgi:hypothetical protein